VYFTLLPSVPSLTVRTRKSVHRTVSQILQLHEDLLAELHRAVPNYDQNIAEGKQLRPTKRMHTRWQSADATPGIVNRVTSTRRQRRSLDICSTTRYETADCVVDTSTSKLVAQIFNRHVGLVTSCFFPI
jgi:hypothetical protein